MAMNKIYPILLAGGSGSRLWPLSRKTYPKQFLNLINERSLFQESVLRLKSSKKINFGPDIVLTNSDFRFQVAEQLNSLGINMGNILIEPKAKNTAPAILAATIFAFNNDKNAVLLVAPSDHIIPDNEKFHDAIVAGLTHTVNNKIVTFGISPSHPETGYGYIEASDTKLDSFGSCNVNRFIEKPDLETAEKMLEKENYFWNAGIFLFKASDMIKAFKNYDLKAYDLVNESLNKAEKDLDFIRLDKESWEQLNDISIDYAIMEKATNLVTVPYAHEWSDMGDWSAVWKKSIKDKDGNSINERAHVIDCSNSFLRSESDDQVILGLGLDNIVAVAMNDAVLVLNKDKSQEVKNVVSYLNNKNIAQGNTYPKDFRPWGWFESLALGDKFQVKRIFVKPGESLSLQSHKFRSEHWIVVEGNAKVTIDSDIKLVSEGQSVYVPLGAKHRLENVDKKPMMLIEVQIGSYLGEDDIVRYEDIYNR
jgi:mannose-1-phosphate guanylyltransferase/mannose-6-phosphate isomerase